MYGEEDMPLIPEDRVMGGIHFASSVQETPLLNSKTLSHGLPQ
jgi:hypothetical protein